MSLNKFTNDVAMREWMRINAKSVTSEYGEFETLESNTFQTLNLTIDNDLTVKDVVYTGTDGAHGSILTTNGAGSALFKPRVFGNFGLYNKVFYSNSTAIAPLVSNQQIANYYGNIDVGLTWNVGDAYRFEVSGAWSSNGDVSTTQSLSFNGGASDITNSVIPLTANGAQNGSWRFICNFSVKSRVEDDAGTNINILQSNNFEWMSNEDNIQRSRSSSGDSSTFILGQLGITFTNQFSAANSSIWVYGFEFVPTYKTII